MSAVSGDLIAQIIEQSEDNCEPQGAAINIAEWVKLGKAGATVFGGYKTIAELLAIAASAGFDLKTGNSRPNMEFGGAIMVTSEGKDLTLFWDAAA